MSQCRHRWLLSVLRRFSLRRSRALRQSRSGTSPPQIIGSGSVSGLPAVVQASFSSAWSGDLVIDHPLHSIGQTDTQPGHFIFLPVSVCPYLPVSRVKWSSPSVLSIWPSWPIQPVGPSLSLSCYASRLLSQSSCPVFFSVRPIRLNSLAPQGRLINHISIHSAVGCNAWMWLRPAPAECSRPS